MIFWTDNFSEPKKVNIERSKQGSDSESNSSIGRGSKKIDDFNQHTVDQPYKRYKVTYFAAANSELTAR